MAYFAKLNADNLVVDVLVVSNDDINNLPFPESEPIGVAFLEKLFGIENGFTWKQTSYNRNFRVNYAGIGFSYDSTNDVFISNQPFPSWVLNTTIWGWESPVPIPAELEGQKIMWDEATLSWMLQTESSE
jgi:hypothetical protein